MFKIGCHLSSAKGFLAMAQETIGIGGNTFQFFTRNPRGGQARTLDMKDVEDYKNYAGEHGISVVLAHAPYTLNACAAEESIRTFSKLTMADDLARLEHIPGSMYNFHPGSHVKQGAEVGIELISAQLNEILTEKQSTIVLLETMAGKGSEVGRSFEELRSIINRVELSDKLGVCLDTCHVYDGGYDIVRNLDGVLEHFDEVLGLARLRAIHINDSMFGFETHKDRHQKIGQGFIGLEAFERIINHPALCELPFYLETPNELDGYKQEIELLKSLRKENSHAAT